LRSRRKNNMKCWIIHCRDHGLRAASGERPFGGKNWEPGQYERVLGDTDSNSERAPSLTYKDYQVWVVFQKYAVSGSWPPNARATGESF